MTSSSAELDLSVFPFSSTMITDLQNMGPLLLRLVFLRDKTHPQRQDPLSPSQHRPPVKPMALFDPVAFPPPPLFLSSWTEGARSDTERRSQGRQRQHSLGSVKDMKSKEPSKVAGKEWLSECGVPGSAPAEIRIFTDGTFPAGFALKLYCHSQPETPQDSGAKARKQTVDRNCSVSLLRLHSTDSARHLCPSQEVASCPLGNSARSNAKDCGARSSRRVVKAGKEDAPLLAKGFNPAWRARFLMDFDATTGHLMCMVCESPLRQVGLATVKQHILQCHAETLHLPREVRRTIREVWESRGQSSMQAPRK